MGSVKEIFKNFRVPLTVHWTCVPVSLVNSFRSLIVFSYLLLFVQLDQYVLYHEQIILSNVAVAFDVHGAFTEVSCSSHFSLRLASDL